MHTRNRTGDDFRFCITATREITTTTTTTQKIPISVKQITKISKTTEAAVMSENVRQKSIPHHQKKNIRFEKK